MFRVHRQRIQTDLDYRHKSIDKITAGFIPHTKRIVKYNLSCSATKRVRNKQLGHIVYSTVKITTAPQKIKYIKFRKQWTGVDTNYKLESNLVKMHLLDSQKCLPKVNSSTGHSGWEAQIVSSSWDNNQSIRFSPVHNLNSIILTQFFSYWPVSLSSFAGFVISFVIPINAQGLFLFPWIKLFTHYYLEN